MCINSDTPRAKRVSAFDCFIIDHRWRYLLIKILWCIAFLSFFASLRCGVIVQVIDEG
jgi:hypothetical protein